MSVVMVLSTAKANKWTACERICAPQRAITLQPLFKWTFLDLGIFAIQPFTIHSRSARSIFKPIAHKFGLLSVPCNIDPLLIPNLEGNFLLQRGFQMATMLREIAKRASHMVVKSDTPQAWNTTSTLRSQYVYTTLDSIPARMADASKEWAQLRKKVASRDVTVNDIGTGLAHAVELYAFYLVGRVIGTRSLST